MASSKKFAKINPRLRQLSAHTLSDGETVITRSPSVVTATQLKEVLEFTVNGHPVAVEVSAAEASKAEEAQGDAESADNADGEA